MSRIVGLVEKPIEIKIEPPVETQEDNIEKKEVVKKNVKNKK